MGCGCNKRGASAVPRAANQLEASAPAPTVRRVAVYEVYKQGEEPVLTTTNATAARQEARRLGASVRVSSRAAEAQKQDLAV
jgi:hypothetical protein